MSTFDHHSCIIEAERVAWAWLIRLSDLEQSLQIWRKDVNGTHIVAVYLSRDQLLLLCVELEIGETSRIWPIGNDVVQFLAGEIQRCDVAAVHSTKVQSLGRHGNT